MAFFESSQRAGEHALNITYQCGLSDSSVIDARAAMDELEADRLAQWRLYRRDGIHLHSAANHAFNHAMLLKLEPAAGALEPESFSAMDGLPGSTEAQGHAPASVGAVPVSAELQPSTGGTMDTAAVEAATSKDAAAMEAASGMETAALETASSMGETSGMEATSGMETAALETASSMEAATRQWDLPRLSFG